MTTQKQLVLDLKVELEKAKATSRAAKEAAEAWRQASYNLGVEETEIQLAEELTEVCRDYCKETWKEALNLVKVLAASEWRQLFHLSSLHIIQPFLESTHYDLINSFGLSIPLWVNRGGIPIHNS